MDPAMSCPYCEEKQYQTQKSKTKAPFLSQIVLLPLLIQIFFDVPGIVLLSLIPVLAVIVFLLYPFLIELSCKEEYINFFKE
ncbi:TIGR04104 family putative zinc finger protein [Virgibacillus ainsalahensis]